MKSFANTKYHSSNEPKRQTIVINTIIINYHTKLVNSKLTVFILTLFQAISTNQTLTLALNSFAKQVSIRKRKSKYLMSFI